MNKNELENAIRHHNDLYWNGKELEISDIEYDKLVEELRKIDPENELITSFVEENSNKEKLIKHSKPMLSLDKIYSKEDLVKWVKKVSRNKDEVIIVQPKYDGMSGLLENGTLSSRGDGEYGQDYTDKLKLIEFDSIKSVNVETDTLLGEIVISNFDFKHRYKNIKSKSGIPFKNQRNGIAGILGTDDTDFYFNQGAKITFVDYDKNSWHTTCENFENDWDEICNLIVTTSKYPLDGIVIKIADKEYAESLGYTSHHPKSQVAYKFTNQTATSKLIDVEWSMGKRQLTAIGIIEPVEISGITIKRVKLQLTKPKNSNVNSCLIDGSLQIGDSVVVERAGDIIPHIVSSNPGIERKRVIIESCPFCGSQLFINDTNVQCSDTEGGCLATYIQEVYNSIITLGFKNVGEAYITTIMTDPNLNVRTIADLFELTPNMLTLKEYGTRKKEIFFEELEKAKKNVTKAQVFASLNMYNIGKTVAKLITDNFDWNELIEGKISYNQFMDIPGIGKTIADTLVTNIGYECGHTKWHTNVLQRMTNLCEFKEEIKIKSSGKTICFTGKMEYKRSEMEKIAIEKGYVPVDKVDKNLSILVCADPNSGSSKLQKAAKYGTQIISVEEFLK
jgi:DNA ligase (NAD+)